MHTLHGSAQTAEVEDIAVLSGTLERIAKAKQELNLAFEKSETELFRDCLECLDQALKWFSHSGEKPRNLRELQAQLRVLEKKVEGQTGEIEQDDELIGIFIEEGDELLENADRLLDQWRQRPDDQRLIADLQRQLHTLKGGARMANFIPIADLSHALETLVVNVTERGVEPEAATFELLHEAVDALTVMLEQARDRQPVSRVDWLLDELTGLSDSESRPRAPAIPDARDTDAPQPRTADESQAVLAAQEQVRVNADLLDNLVNYAGEVNIYQSRLGQQVTDYRFNLEELDQTVFRLRDQLRKMDMETEAQILHRFEKEGGKPADEDFDPLELDRYSQIQELSRALMESVADLESIKSILGDLTRDSESLLQQQTRLSSDLQDGLMRTRMVRFDRLSARLARVVRQTATTLSKKAELEIRGGSTEIDRTVQERMIAPLEHMLRNAVSHGVELPGERRRLGKPVAGRILINLQRDGTDVLITVADDGNGINLQAVRSKAITRGLLTREAHVSDEDLLQLVLETGMSTAQEVTQISGRGVGLDVVASEIKQLGGAVNIDTTPGQGTRFVVRLPLTLAINQALLVDVAGDIYALPLTGIVGVSQVDGTELQRYYVDRSQKYHYAGYEYEIQHLGSMLDVGTPRLGEQNQVWPLIMLRSGDHRVAIHVEGLRGRREVVVKPVGPQISTVRGISGATILADGRVVL
ncbi:MAG: chemotaxis protein CheA, partial [Gammaproteobacteria bacterium]|nr:chemotaxis protein CheA [Gammaproteobacteria bacterium]